MSNPNYAAVRAPRAKKLLALTRYCRDGASSRVRFYQFVPALEAAGYTVMEAPLFGPDYVARLYRGGSSIFHTGHDLLRRALSLMVLPKVDLIWVEKEVLPWLPPLVERLLFRAGAPFILDLDDAWFHRYDLHPSAWVRKMLGKRIDILMRRAALTIVGNDYLAARAHAAGAPRIEIIPSVVDTKRYPIEAVSAPSKPRPIIGWIGTPVTSHYLDHIRKALAIVCARDAAELLIIGGASVEIPGVRVRTVPWSEEHEAKLLATCDIGIMPLEDGAWERGKCGYKLIQYMAAGLPCVASPVGINSIIITAETGFLADDVQAWVRTLNQLVQNRELRQQMGAAARERVEERYSLKVWGPRFAALMTSALRVP